MNRDDYCLAVIVSLEHLADVLVAVISVPEVVELVWVMRLELCSPNRVDQLNMDPE